MKYDDYADQYIECCSQCSMNRKTYPQKTNACLNYKDNYTETTMNGFPKHCKLEEVK